MNKSMLIGLAAGAGAVGWGVYRTTERKKCLEAALSNNRIKAAMVTAVMMNSQGLLPEKYAWLQSPESVAAQINGLILFTNTMKAPEALQVLLQNLIPAQKPEGKGVAGELMDNLINIFEEKVDIDIPDSVERELEAAAGKAGSGLGGTVYSFVYPQQEAQPNPNLGWDEFLERLR